MTGNGMTGKARDGIARAMMRNEVFKKQKFLQPEDLTVDGNVSNRMRRTFGHKKKHWLKEWETWGRSLAWKALNEKRNNVTQIISEHEKNSKCLAIHMTHMTCVALCDYFLLVKLLT